MKAFAFALGATALAGLASAETIVAGGTGTSPPFHFVMSDGEPVGITVDLLQAIADDLDIEVEQRVPVAAAELIPALIDGTIDITPISVAVAKGKAGIVLSIPYTEEGDGIWVLRSDRTEYRSFEDLRGEVVGAVAGATPLAPLPGPFAEVKTYEDANGLAKAVARGEIKAGVTNGATARFTLFMAGYSDLRVPQNWSATSIYTGFGMRDTDLDLRARVNASLNKLMDDGTVARIYAEYGLTWIDPFRAEVY